LFIGHYFAQQSQFGRVAAVIGIMATSLLGSASALSIARE